MTITYVGGQVAGRAGATSTANITFALTGGSNATPQAGDLVIIGVTIASAGRTPACAVSGYTAGTQQNANGTTYDTSLNKSWKFMTATPDTTFVLPSSGNIQDAQRYTVQVWRGVDPTNPFDVADIVATGTATGRPNPGSITPITAGAVIGIIGAGAAATGVAYTAPANYTTNFLTGFTADTNDAMIGSGYRSWTSGAEDPAAYTGGTANATDSWAAITYALRPAPTPNLVAGTNASTTNTGTQVAIQNIHGVKAGNSSQTNTGTQVALYEAPTVRPVRISTTLWQQDTLGTSGTPGAKSITVPADAQGVVVQAHSTMNANPPSLSITSDFAGTFTVINSNDQDGCSIGYAEVTSTGAKNLTLAWTEGILEGPSVYISFIKNINTSDWVREAAAVSTGAASGNASNVFDTSTNDLLLVVDEQDGGDGIPATISGFTSLATTDGTYNSASRLQSCDTPGATTTTVTATGTHYDTLSGISIKGSTAPPADGNMVVANSTQSNTGTQAAIKQTHKISGAVGQQNNTVTQTSIKQTFKIGVTNSSTSNTVVQGAIKQTHKIVSVTSQQSNAVIPIAIRVTHKVTVTTSQQNSVGTTGAIKSTHLIRGTNATTVNTGTQVAAGDIAKSLISMANASQANTVTSVGIKQTHKLGVTNGSTSHITTQVAIKPTHRIAGLDGVTSHTAAQAAIKPTHLVKGTASTTAATGTQVATRQTHKLAGLNGNTSHTTTQVSTKQTHLIGAANATVVTTGTQISVNQAITHAVSVASAVQTKTGTQVAVKQTHKVASAIASSANAGVQVGIKQTHKVGVVNASRSSTGTQVAVRATHLVRGTNGTTGNTGAQVAVIKVIRVGGTNASQANSGSQIAVRPTHAIRATDTTRVHSGSTGAIRQTHRIGSALSGQGNSCTQIGIRQTHIVQALNGLQGNSVSMCLIDSGQGFTMQAWDGATWVTGMLKRWNGSGWSFASPKRWNGSTWI